MGATSVCTSSNVGRAGGVNKGVNKGKARLRRARGMYMCRMGLDGENWRRIREPGLRIEEGERRGDWKREREREIVVTQLRKQGQRSRLKWSGIETGKG